MVQHFTTSYCTKIMACRQVWISNKNVCVLYHVTAAAGLLREPQPSPSTLARAHTHTQLAGMRRLFLLWSHGSSRSRARAARVGGDSDDHLREAWNACQTLTRRDEGKLPAAAELCQNIPALKLVRFCKLLPAWTWSHVLITVYVRWWYKPAPLIHLCWTTTINLPYTTVTVRLI